MSTVTSIIPFLFDNIQINERQYECGHLFRDRLAEDVPVKKLNLVFSTYNVSLATKSQIYKEP